jgi:hypothetical protein
MHNKQRQNTFEHADKLGGRWGAVGFIFEADDTVPEIVQYRLDTSSIGEPSTLGRKIGKPGWSNKFHAHLQLYEGRYVTYTVGEEGRDNIRVVFYYMVDTDDFQTLLEEFDIPSLKVEVDVYTPVSAEQRTEIMKNVNKALSSALRYRVKSTRPW